MVPIVAVKVKMMVMVTYHHHTLFDYSMYKLGVFVIIS